MFNLIIAGSRDFNDYNLLRDAVNYYLVSRNLTEVTIVSGKARGADTLGEQYAREKGFPVLEFAADWNRYGKSAGHRRNREMAHASQGLVALWDGTSPGTKGMIDYAQSQGLNVLVITYKK